MLKKSAVSNATEYAGKQPGWRSFALGVALVLLLGTVDCLTGRDASFLVFYLVPISFAAWFGGQGRGLLTALVSGGVWCVDDLSGLTLHSHPFVLLWNVASKLGFFAIYVHVLCALKKALEREKGLARTDSLTGLTNRRAFFELAGAELLRSRRYQRPFSVAYLDVDDFKAVNDRLGHGAGDALLRLIADTMRGTVRAIDVVARLGGDEFAILLAESGPEAAVLVFQKVRTNLLQAVQEKRLRVTVSLGAVTFMTPPGSDDEMLRIADTVMYSAKRAGKNTVKHEVFRGSEPAAAASAESPPLPQGE